MELYWTPQGLSIGGDWLTLRNCLFSNILTQIYTTPPKFRFRPQI
jgi:hypothetical protein